MRDKINFTLGIILFGFGCLIYALTRQSSQFFISEIQLPFILPQIITLSSPAFFHTLSMILISSPFIERKNTSIIMLCLFWTGIQVLFELGQKYPYFSPKFSPDYFYYLNQYFKNGTYDPKDIGMAVAAGLAGTLILFISQSNFLFSKKVLTYVRKK
jgi:hypothetical protein